MRFHRLVVPTCIALALCGAAALAGSDRTAAPAPVPSSTLGADMPVTALNTDAGPPCGTRHELLDRLRRIYAESPTGAGLVDSGTMVEIVATPGGRTWTLVLTRADGTSCVIAAGEHWIRHDAATVSDRTL